MKLNKNNRDEERKVFQCDFFYIPYTFFGCFKTHFVKISLLEQLICFVSALLPVCVYEFVLHKSKLNPLYR